MNNQQLISISEQGRSVQEGRSVKDDASPLVEIIAASAANRESRMTHQGESICKDARY